jgi:cytidyltransferase-like protein
MKNILLPMVCDLFHYGHLGFIKKVKDRNSDSKIIIGLYPDNDVKKYKRLPILNVQERKKILEGCKYVDKVVVCPIDKHLEIVKENNIDLVIHAHSEHEHEKYRFIWGDIEDKFIRYDYHGEISTTEIINRIKDRFI